MREAEKEGEDRYDRLGIFHVYWKGVCGDGRRAPETIDRSHIQAAMIVSRVF